MGWRPLKTISEESPEIRVYVNPCQRRANPQKARGGRARNRACSKRGTGRLLGDVITPTTLQHRQCDVVLYARR
ncbi:hypothetical protein NDU88_008754 [Pleurodeles waltl]|uniref:Uncharacterized protein n=1 Tax=Pleurodeles waltl TaxID=8319 RepID=A0AAV7RTB0_PLEWA|nr:hypothetical protein NDU88_008754 [Pleurodeles waltl]